MVTKKEEINSTEAFTSILFNEEGKPDIFMQNCPHCHSADIKIGVTTPKVLLQAGSIG